MINFQILSPANAPELWQAIAKLPLPAIDLLQYAPPTLIPIPTDTNDPLKDPETQRTDWMIKLFNDLFAAQNVMLVHASDVGKQEPEYLPAVDANDVNQKSKPAKICFAHGFFASSLHEISHWTIAGKQRRLLNDFGYWYAPDGRSEAQQQHFEKVEIKPQAIECLLTLACEKVCGYSFSVSQDNLFADFDTSHSTFEADVFSLATDFLHEPSQLPKDAQTLLSALYHLCAKIQ